MKTLLRVVLVSLWIALGLTAQAAFAQTSATTSSLTQADYDSFQATATQVEQDLAQDRATNLLEALRSDLTRWRTRFTQAQTLNADRIESVKEQIEALGAAPEEGATENAEIAAQRAALNEQLAQLQAPVLQASQASTRADGLITEIDRKIRERQTEVLFSSGPTPLNPTHWATAGRAVTRTSERLISEVSSAYNAPTYASQLRSVIPEVLFFLALALVLLMRGRGWMEGLANRFVTRGHGLANLAISLGQVILPVLGLIALARALQATDLLGIRGYMLIDALPAAGVFFFVARWLGLRLFPKREDAVGVAQVSDKHAARARHIFAGLGALLTVPYLIDIFASYEAWSDETIAVLNFPVILVAAVLLYALGRIIRKHLMGLEDEESETPPLRNRILSMLATGLGLVALAGPVLAAVGYGNAANALVYPMIMSLGLLALLWVLQRLSGSLFAFLTNQGPDALWPVLANFALVILSLPFFALIWGARVADLTELLAQIREGFQLGDTRISPTIFLTFAVIFAIGYTLTRLVQSTLKSNVLPKTRMDKGGQNAVTSGVGYLGIFLSAIIAITAAGIDLSSLAIVAGALSVGIGFGLQNIVSNFVSGIILLIERPISEGDWIEVGGQMGYVRNISVRSTRIETFDRSDVIVPNADLVSGTVTNYTRGNTVGRVIVPVGVAYGTDTRKVETILKEIAESHPLVLLNPAPAVVFQGFGADSMDFEIRAILRDVNWVLSVKSEMNHSIAKRFDEEGIEIPFAQRDVWLRNPEVLKTSK